MTTEIKITIKNDSEILITVNNKEIFINKSQPPESLVKVDSDGGKHWYNVDSQYHRTDGPAVEYSDGTKAWYINGQLHRADGPAIEYSDGTKAWYIDDKLHRTDGPAIIRSNGNKGWYINGKQPTEEEFTTATKPPESTMTVDVNGYKEWWIDGKLHRTDGPALEYVNGYKAWLINGKYHREDGPAVEYPDGDKFWYLHDKAFTEEEFMTATKPPESTMIVDEDGSKEWRNADNEFHRTDGPAMDYADGYKAWLINGQHHRIDGPAIEHLDGYKKWYINGKELSEEEFMVATKK